MNLVFNSIASAMAEIKALALTKRVFRKLLHFKIQAIPFKTIIQKQKKNKELCLAILIECHNICNGCN